ncbi:Chromatin complex subunit a, partial [Thalictrum thalictroides]
MAALEASGGGGGGPPKPSSSSSMSMKQVVKTKTLIYALNLISRNLPLPSHVFDTVSSIYCSDDDDDDGDNDDDDNNDESNEDNREVEEENSNSEAGNLQVGDVLANYEDALQKQRSNCMSGMGLKVARESRLKSNIQHRLTELEELPSSRGEDLQMKCLLELHGLK